MTDGVLPQQPDECDVYLITGSKAGVYDTLSWLPPLREWIQQAYASTVGQQCAEHGAVTDEVVNKVGVKDVRFQQSESEFLREAHE